MSYTGTIGAIIPSAAFPGAHALQPKLSSLLDSAEHGDKTASEQLFQTLYAELHRLAKRELWRNNAQASLSPTTVLHETFLDMSGREEVAFPDRARFMAYAARAMRGLVIDYARNRHAQKRGGRFEFTALNTDIVESVVDDNQLSRVGEAVDELAVVDPALAQVVDLKFFCGFSFAEIAALRGVSERTVQRDWKKARIYLHRVLRDDASLP
jgi:RNA polymerase sigma factor (TIGR02999 family)